MLNGKKYVLGCIGMVFILLVCIAVFNLWQDPAGIFAGENPYKTMAKESCSGKKLVVSGNYDERLFTKNVIELGDNRYDVIVLGSSRIMDIGEQDFPDEIKVRNLGVSGAALEDDIAIWESYVTHMDALPKLVIVGIDPWLFNRHNGENRWKSLTEEYLAGMKRLGLKSDVQKDNERYRSLLSISYTKESWKKYRNPVKPLEVPLEIWNSQEESAEDKSLIYADGSRMGSRKSYREDAEAKARAYVRDKVYHLEKYKELDEGLRDIFSAWIKSMQKQGIKVIFFLPPYHPLVYDHLQQNIQYKNAFEAGAWAKDFAADQGIDIIGAYNPQEMGVGKDAFIDGMHMKRQYQSRYVMSFLKDKI